MKGYGRRFYSFMLRLHPADFYEEFGAEMALDLEEACRTFGLVAVYGDVLLSFARQWFVATIPKEQEGSVPTGVRLLSGHYCVVESGGLTVSQLARGLVLSVVLFTTFWTTESPAKGEWVKVEAGSRMVQAANVKTEAGGEREIEVRDVTIIDVESGRLLTHKTVVIRGGRIESVSSVRDAKARPSADLLDGRGKFLIPGMWDMHTHITRTEIDMPLYIANGVLGIRNMGGVEEKVFAWQKQLQDGTLLGPMAYVSGPILDGPGGPVQPASYGDFIANGEQGRREVDRLKARGADFVKVYDALSRESYFAIADEAKKVGIPLAGHVPAVVTILEAVGAGQRSIEHGIEARGETTAEQALIDRGQKENFMAEAKKTGDFTLIPRGIARNGKLWMDNFSQEKADALYKKLAQSGVYLCPTLSVQHWFAYGDDVAKMLDGRKQYILPKTLVYWDPAMNMITKYRTPDYIAWTKARYAKAMEQVPREQAAGVQFLTGTDLTVPFTYPGSSVHDEMKMFVTAGLTPLQALQAGTTHPVTYFGLQRTMGSVEVGKRAELVVLDGNPLSDIENVGKIAAVITHGKILRRAELDAMMMEAARAAKSAK